MRNHSIIGRIGGYDRNLVPVLSRQPRPMRFGDWLAMVSFDDIEVAFHFVSGAPDGTNTAYLNRETGEIFFDSEFDEVDELPDDLDDDQKYVTIPHRDDFDLGLSLVRSFVAQRAQDKSEDLLGCFRSKGAYSRFKRVLEEFGLLESWHAFENEAVTLALKGWCAEHEIVVG